MKRMRIRHHPDGRVEVEMEGFAGKSCYDFAAPFKRALGVDERAGTDTADAYREPDASEEASGG